MEALDANNEASLLEAACNLDRDALASIFNAYAPMLYKYARRLGQDPVEADNVVGDVFARLLDQLAVKKGPRSNLRAYLYQTAYHLIVDRARQGRSVTSLDAIQIASTESVPGQVEKQTMLETLLVAVNELNEDQRNVIVLRFLENFNVEETARILGKEINNIKVIQHRALAKLRQKLDLQLG